jgi:hypothetical protein
MNAPFIGWWCNGDFAPTIMQNALTTPDRD